MGASEKHAAAFHPGDGPTPRTAADVLGAHARIGPRGQRRCGWYPAMRLNDTDADRRQHDQHQADMLAVAGVLATTEHDASEVLRRLPGARSSKAAPGYVFIDEVVFDAWLAEHDAEVRAQALRAWITEWPATPGDGTFLATVAREGRARADRIAAGEEP
jgi:hypothetical protein